jgi:hypothetical protein
VLLATGSLLPAVIDFIARCVACRVIAINASAAFLQLALGAAMKSTLRDLMDPATLSVRMYSMSSSSSWLLNAWCERHDRTQSARSLGWIAVWSDRKQYRARGLLRTRHLTLKPPPVRVQMQQPSFRFMLRCLQPALPRPLKQT